MTVDSRCALWSGLGRRFSGLFRGRLGRTTTSDGLPKAAIQPAEAMLDKLTGRATTLRGRDAFRGRSKVVEGREGVAAARRRVYLVESLGKLLLVDGGAARNGGEGTASVPKAGGRAERMGGRVIRRLRGRTARHFWGGGAGAKDALGLVETAGGGREECPWDAAAAAAHGVCVCYSGSSKAGHQARRGHAAGPETHAKHLSARAQGPPGSDRAGGRGTRSVGGGGGREGRGKLGVARARDRRPGVAAVTVAQDGGKR